MLYMYQHTSILCVLPKANFNFPHLIMAKRERKCYSLNLIPLSSHKTYKYDLP